MESGEKHIKLTPESIMERNYFFLFSEGGVSGKNEDSEVCSAEDVGFVGKNLESTSKPDPTFTNNYKSWGVAHC